MSDGLLKDETIQKNIEKYGRECYLGGIRDKLKKGEIDYKRGKKKLLHILERIEKDFN